MKVIRDKVLIADCETTGVSGTDQVIELAYFPAPENIRDWVADYISSDFDNYYVDTIYNERFKPSVPINPHAYKVHGIGKIHLLKCRPSTEAVIPTDTKYLIGHNIAFDYRMLGKPENLLLIDTLVIVRILRKLGMLTNDEMDGKDKLDVLVEHYYPTIASTLIKPLHSALDDCYKVVLLLAEILRLFPNVNTWDALYELQTMGKKK